jgi:hypothetical protein
MRFTPGMSVLRHQGLNSKGTSVNSTIKPTDKPTDKINEAGLQASSLLGYMGWSGMREHLLRQSLSPKAPKYIPFRLLNLPTNLYTFTPTHQGESKCA